MKQYRVEITNQAVKSLKRLPKPLAARLLHAAQSLKDNPRPESCKKLRGYDSLYRIRLGDWRIIYSIEDEILLVLVITIKSRAEVYKDI